MEKFTDLEHLELVAQRLKESGTDITSSYDDWMNVTFACASLGEGAREYYQTICSAYPEYQREVCDEKFDNCLRTGRGQVTFATLLKMAKDAGIDISLPRGRRQKSEKHKEEEQENRMRKMREFMSKQGEWRFNVWLQRPEVKEEGGLWRPVQDRDLDTYYCRLKENGLNVRLQDVRSMIYNRDFCPEFDAFCSWLDSLRPWNPDTDPDYLYEFYAGHLEFVDSENKQFYTDIFKKWHVCMVKLMKGLACENPIMPIFRGDQHIGKSFFTRHILPPVLRKYLVEVGPSQRMDKDLIISLSETPLILFDEISFASGSKNDAFKYLVTSNQSNLRDAFGHFREERERRASLVATTNESNFISEAQGSRRYLVVNLKGTVNLDQHPLPYEGAYAQALYLMEHGFNPKPTQEESQQITEHNKNFMESNDCEEALRTIIRKPDGQSNVIAMSAGDILRELNLCGFRGAKINTNNIGKTLKQNKFDSKMVKGSCKYLVTKLNYQQRELENKDDVSQFAPAENQS